MLFNSARTSRRRAIACAVYRPCLKAFLFPWRMSEDAMSRTKAAVVFQQSPSSQSLLDVKEIPANGSRN
jgi:hypothetical protein